jgi:hypothetical protein
VSAEHVEILDGRLGARTIRESFGHEDTWAFTEKPTAADLGSDGGDA